MTSVIASWQGSYKAVLSFNEYKQKQQIMDVSINYRKEQKQPSCWVRTPIIFTILIFYETTACIIRLFNMRSGILKNLINISYEFYSQSFFFMWKIPHLRRFTDLNVAWMNIADLNHNWFKYRKISIIEIIFVQWKEEIFMVNHYWKNLFGSWRCTPCYGFKIRVFDQSVGTSKSPQKTWLNSSQFPLRMRDETVGGVDLWSQW